MGSLMFKRIRTVNLFLLRWGKKRASPAVLLTRGLRITCSLGFLAPVCSLLLGPGATPLSPSDVSSLDSAKGDGGNDEDTSRGSVRIAVRSRSRCLCRSGGQGHNPERLGE